MHAESVFKHPTKVYIYVRTYTYIKKFFRGGLNGKEYDVH
jgi:hypothetical protein